MLATRVIPLCCFGFLFVWGFLFGWVLLFGVFLIHLVQATKKVF